MKLYFIRHGETTWNRAGRVQGHRGDSELMPGEFHRAMRIAKEVFAPLPIKAIYSSDLLRTQQTALAISEVIHVPVKFDRRLREFHRGVFEGTFSKDVREHPDFRAPYGSPFVAFPGGESSHDVHFRLKMFLEDLKKNHQEDDQVVIVTHGGYIRMVHAYFQNMHLKDLFTSQRASNLEVFAYEL